MDLSQPFNSCSVCHVDGKIHRLFLTSCAHILCEEHAAKHSQNPSHLTSAKTRCLACGKEYVTILRIDQRLPAEIKPFFTPFPSQIEQFFAVTQFQYVGMSEKLIYQEGVINKLTAKMQKQKELLMIAKEKVSQVESLQNRVHQLEQENQSLKSSGSHRLPHSMERHHLPTIDLTSNNSFEKELNLKSSNVTDSFLHEIKKSSSQKVTYKSSRSNSTNNDFGKNKIAESTNIMTNSPQRSIPIGSKLQSVNSYSRGQTPKTVSSTYSNGSSNTSFTSGAFVSPPVMTKSRPGHENRVAKTRASTSQIAQRLSAHMKIGTFDRQSQSSNGLSMQRPGSSFSQHIFKRR